VEAIKKSLVGLIVFEIISIIIDCCAVYLLFPVFAMFLQYNLSMLFVSKYYFIFYGIVIALLFLAIILIVNLFRLKKWSFNIFVVFTLIINLPFIVYPLLGGFVAVFLLYFIIYFFKPSIRGLFK